MSDEIVNRKSGKMRRVCERDRDVFIGVIVIKDSYIICFLREDCDCE